MILLYFAVLPLLPGARNLYKQRDEITEQAKKMHRGLKFCDELEFGYKVCGAKCFS